MPMGWPVYFAKRPLRARRLVLAKGDPFPIQDKFFIVGLAPAYGIKDGRHFSALDYVETLDVGTAQLAQVVLDRNLPIGEARKLVRGEAPPREAAA